jgi:hypothetical protein
MAMSSPILPRYLKQSATVLAGTVIGNLLYRLRLDAGVEGFAGCADDAERDWRALRCPFLPTDEHPDLMRRLGRQLMELNRGEKADDTVRDGECGLRKAVRSREFGIGQLIEPSPGLDQEAFIPHPPQIDAGHAGGAKVAGARDSLLAGDGERGISGPIPWTSVLL